MATSRAWLLGIALVLASAPAAAGDSPLEAACALKTLDGARYDLGAAVQHSRAVLLVFWSTECPCVRRYQARVEELLRRYGPSRVTILGVDSNAGETPADIQRVLQERRVTIPVVRDPGGKLAEAVGARSTPTAIILDEKGEVIFRGWIDNEREPGAEDREPYVERALDALLAGSRDFSKRSPVYGCRITRKLFGSDDEAQCLPPGGKR